MPRLLLQEMIRSLKYNDLPVSWNSFDLESFSKTKTLWDYQQEALINAIKVLWKYFEDFFDYRESEKLELNQQRKQDFFQWYKDNGLDEELDIKLKNNTGKNREVIKLLDEYYTSQTESLITYERSIFSYENFINRMCFWMATGSGKTLIIIKLIQILRQLIKRGEIPPYEILILTYRDDLIEQLKEHVDEFNYANSECFIKLRELRDYDTIKWENPTLFRDNEITVFYYRSDNLSDVQKEKIIDFGNYDNDGRWYVFLDEAHKGDREDSKRQQIYSILSRNGFLFNFSATFTDQRDVITCAYEFNLSTFIKEGYGKHIGILEQEIRAFRDEEDYTGEEKQKIVLKSLILLAYVKKFYEKTQNINPNLYHNPLILTLVNSVNTEDADLKLFFRELERIGKEELTQELFDDALDELWRELSQEPEFMFENRRIELDKTTFKSTTTKDVLSHVYNSKTSGEIEVLRRPSNRKELAFKLKTSDRPFALIKIGDISGWLKEELIGYEIQERFEEESYFENLNQEDSDINILMGSRSFYEGWDSNRPNVINYINIGIGQDAKKFILQSVGRGVRIEPIENKRKRLLSLYNAKEIDEKLFNKIKEEVLPIESLFIFGTNRNALKTVIQELHKEKEEDEGNISLELNEETRRYKLLVPIYKSLDTPIINTNRKIKFDISKEDFEILNEFVKSTEDDGIFLMRYNIDPVKIELLKESIENKERYYRFNEKRFNDKDLLVQNVFNYFSIVPQECDGVKELGKEINHFKNIKVSLSDISKIQKKIDSVKNYPIKEKKLNEQYGKISQEEYLEMAKNLSDEEEYEKNNKKIRIKYVANHYYIPIILSSDDDKVDYIKHIIKTPSEVKFINDLNEYLKSEHRLKEFDWWMFSKLDEILDKVRIPYYNPKANKFSDFHPDFIFWFQKEDEYFILFVDPKGTEHTSAYRKIDGYKELFEENGKDKFFRYDGLKVRIKLLLRPEDISRTLNEYRQYWFNDVEKIVDVIE